MTNQPRRRGSPGGGRGGASHRRTLFVDVSVIVRHDAGTGIQRVVRALGEHLRSLDQGEFDVRFVGASRRLPYRFVDAELLRAGAQFYPRQVVCPAASR